MMLGIEIGFLNFRLIDFIDVLLVSIFLYQTYNLLKGSVAIRILVGLVSLVLFYVVFRALEMELLSTIFGWFFALGPLAAVIIFHQEIRKFLLMVGKTTTFREGGVLSRLRWRRSDNRDHLNLSPVAEAAKTLGATKTGALIVFSRNSPLKFYAESGDLMDALLSKRLLLSIFNKESPLHDGAVIIYNNRVAAARCILPVTEREDVPAQYGLRHRAALGMSEVTDTIILAVSEETGKFSIARNGRLYTQLKLQEVRDYIRGYYEDREVYTEPWDDEAEVLKPPTAPEADLPKTKEERLKEMVAKEKEKEVEAERLREDNDSM